MFRPARLPRFVACLFRLVVLEVRWRLPSASAAVALDADFAEAEARAAWRCCWG